MPQQMLHLIQTCPIIDGNGRMSVSQIVDSEILDACPLQRANETLLWIVQWLAFQLTWENVSIQFRQTFQQSQRLRIQNNVPMLAVLGAWNEPHLFG